MTDNVERLEAAELLEKHEIGLAHLYEVYAQKIPEHEAFWRALSTEERTHAFLVRNFRGLMDKKGIKSVARPFRRQEVEAAIKSLGDYLDYARREEISAGEALSTALELEARAIESMIFEVYEDDGEDLKRMLSTLSDDTRRHADTIREKFNQVINQ